MMPRIEVYKGNGSMIPVETAKKGKAFICPWTKKMYTKKQDYIKHLKNLRETRMHKRAREIVRNRVKQDLWKQSSFDDIIKWFNLHPEFLFQRMLSHQWHDRQKYYEKYRETFMMEITHLDLHWSDRCSNTQIRSKSNTKLHQYSAQTYHAARSTHQCIPWVPS